MKDYDWSRHYLQSDYNRITFTLLLRGNWWTGGIITTLGHPSNGREEIDYLPSSFT